MQAFRQYWSFSAIRGAMTIVACIAIIGIPNFAAAILPIPVVMGFALDCFATYCMLDAGAVVLLGFSMPAASRSRRTLFAQAAASIALAFLFYVASYGAIRPEYLMPLVAIQAMVTALAESVVARDTQREYKSPLCFASTAVLAICALALPFAYAFDTDSKLVVLSGYVGLYGFTQLALASTMLFREYRAEHPATVLSEDWRQEMYKPFPVDRALTPGQRTAAALRNGYVMPGQARVLPGPVSLHRHAA